MTAISNYLRIRARVEHDKTLESSDPVCIIEGLRRAKRYAVKAMDAENKERKEQGK